MTAEDHIHKAVIRCATILHRYRVGEETAAAKARMVAGMEMVVCWLRELGLLSGATRDELISQVEKCLHARYGRETGRRLGAQFVETFDEIPATLNRSRCS